jgi:hypothetical protein
VTLVLFYLLLFIIVVYYKTLEGKGVFTNLFFLPKKIQTTNWATREHARRNLGLSCTGIQAAALRQHAIVPNV